ncbi:hypothetical protein [Prosthecobacter sp.]|uniref:hypothetical protein n=1 Tax=Prosthecobacter sp. TaxID=1965333 RepID=UPI0037846B36
MIFYFKKPDLGPKIIRDQFVTDLLRQDITAVSTRGFFHFVFNSSEQKTQFIKLIAEARLWEERTHGMEIGSAEFRRDKQFYSVHLDESSVDHCDFIIVDASGPVYGRITLGIPKDLSRPYLEQYQKMINHQEKARGR